MCDTYTSQRQSIFIRDNPISSSEGMLHKDYDRKDSVKKISGRGSQGAWRQDELIDGKPPVVKWLWLRTEFRESLKAAVEGDGKEKT
jgi:hypothetical protein